MKEKLHKYHEEHLNGEESKEEDEKSEVQECSQIEPSSVSESVADSQVETMDIVPERKEDENTVEEIKEEASALEADPESEEEQKSKERSADSKMEVESTVTEAPIELDQAPMHKIDFPPYEA